MDDKLTDEEVIAHEQDHSRNSLNSNAFLRPIKELCLPKVITVDCAMSISDALSLMQDKKIGSLVITKDGQIDGIFTERDALMKVVNKMSNLESKPISNVMTADPQCLREGDELAYVLNNMHVGGYRHVPIVDADDIPVSMVSIKDVVSWILDQFPEEITNLTGEPFRGPKVREGA